MNSILVAKCSLTDVFVLRACSQLKIVMPLLDNIIDEENEKKKSSQQNLAVIVDYHLRVLSLQVNRWFLLPIGAWPLANTSNAMLKILARLHVLVCATLIFVIMFPCLLYILIEEKNVKLKLKAIAPLIHRVMGTVNYWTLIMRSDDIRNCIRHMEADWKTVRRAKDRDIMMQHAKFGRFIASICAVIMQGGACFFNIAQAVKTTTFIFDNETYTMHPMTCPVYSKFVDTRFTPVNEIMLTVQFMSTFVASCSTVGACSLAAVFAMHACGQLNVLYVWLDDLAKYQEKRSRETQRKLAVAVEHHLRILSFIKCVESIMHKASLAELAGCTINMCLLGYYCIMVQLLESVTADWNYSIQLNRWFLKPIGLWPLNLCETTMEKLGCVILTIVSCFLICFLLIPCTLCTILVDTDLDTKIRMIGPVSFILMAVVKQYILIARSENISECIQHVREDWTRVALGHEKDRQVMIDNAKFGRWLSIVSAIFMYSAGIFFTTLMPIIAKRTEIIDNETVRLLSFPIYRGILDPRTTPSFEIAQFTQALAGYVIYTLTIGVCSLAAVFVMHACGQFRILMLKMDDLADGRKRKSAGGTSDERLGDIVQYHIRILSFITRTEKILNEIFFVDVVGCTLNICFLGFNMMTCLQIGIKSYMIDWYRIPSKGALGLTLVMSMSNATIKLTAGKFMDLSLASFCSLCRWILKPIGIWYLIYEGSSRIEKLISLTLIFACFSVLCFVLVPAGPYTLLREKDINMKVKLFGPVGFCLTSAIKYCIMWTRVAAIGRCVEHVEHDWRIVRHQDHRRMMLRNALVGRRLTTLCVIFLYTGGMSYHTIMPLSVLITTNNSLVDRRLVYPGYDLYFDPRASPAYEIVFCVHCLSAMIQYSITTAACSLAAIFATHARGQVQILMTLLDDLVEGRRKTDDTVAKRLCAIARHHVRVLRFAADVEEILREICLMEMVASTLIICLLEYYCMMEWKNSDAVAIITYFILLISLTFNILIFCYIGELLVEEYSKIGSAAYKINWYDLPGHKAVDLVMIIAMSHYPPKLTAGKFCDLSLNTFSTVSSLDGVSA
ncbi:uncharacterized protein LOC109860688 [Pseudomyrmex gracilis]|uniref:uncharacterized protein LOC109860688 n=1 Tax=Pseudomyrmex gracilis TaxID=219809 RepID=UPI0009955574|nr:uncharacterized protein LOC109860688 [Pseudomyrmex gracilis]